MKTSPKGAATFDECVVARLDRLSPAEQRVARFFIAHREEVLVASASQLAKRIGTSDATVIRATKALGYPGMNELRRELADELRASLSPAATHSSNVAYLHRRRQQPVVNTTYMTQYCSVHYK